MAANHIGNTQDLPPRTIQCVSQSDIIVFEEDRAARATLKAAKIHRQYLKYNEHNQKDTLEHISTALKLGKTVCYISDQGNPCLADPGHHIVKLGTKLDCHIQIIPGPSSITAAISACPFPMESFVYSGFLPRETNKREKAIQQIVKEKLPCIILDTPYRMKSLIQLLESSLPSQRHALLAVDITGPQENYFFGKLSNLKKKCENLPKLNFVLIINK